MSHPASILPRAVLGDVRQMILAAWQEVARTVDAGLVTLYWHIGQRVRQDVLQLKRAEYGERIVSALGRQLHETLLRVRARLKGDSFRDNRGRITRVPARSAPTRIRTRVSRCT